MDCEVAVESGEEGSHPVERANAHAEECSRRVGNELGERRREPRAGNVEWELEQNLDLPRPRHARQRRTDVRDRIEVGGRIVKRALDEDED
jgi:hypothetical protein